MKKFALKSLLLLFIVFLVDRPVGFFISKWIRAKQADNRLELLVNNKIKQDLIILGSSRAVNDIDPEIIEKNTGVSSYNMGFSGSNLNFHKEVLKLILKFRQTKHIILTVDGHLTFQKSKMGIFRDDKLEPYLCYDEILSLYTSNTEKNYFACKLSWSYRENQNFFGALEYLRKGKEEGDETSAINEYGAIFLTGNKGRVDTYPEDDRIIAYAETVENDLLLASFDEILELCEQNYINLTVVIPPNFHRYSPEFNSRLIRIIDGRCTLLNLSEKLQRKELYFDNGHLNREGAREFTQLISAMLET